MNCGLLGRTLAHSYSPQIHSYLGNYSYALFECEPHEIGTLLQDRQLDALNVTIPYKKDVIPFCTELTDCAKKMGAVNTIVRRDDGSLIGHNTDYFGFHYTLQRMGLRVAGKKVLVLGSGGASVTAVKVLEELDAEVIIISRTGDNNYTNLNRHADASVIVNGTPVGMYPNAGVSPVDLDLFPVLEGVVDIVYNPSRTQLLLDAAARSIPCENGLWMLIAQAKESAEWFTGTKISDDVIPEIYRKLSMQMENIVLIGMPGCGKTTVGQILARTLNREFVDADAQIVSSAEMSIPEIFAEHGEDGFRKLETQVLAQLGQRSSLVIATGGGCVTKPANYHLLHQNGTIYWLQRDISALPTEGRPLSQVGQLEQMYTARKPLYERFADFTVPNNAAPQEAIEAILKGRGI